MTATDSESVRVARFAGWTAGGGASSADLRLSSFFDGAGEYTGPDKHGIEPVWIVDGIGYVLHEFDRAFPIRISKLYFHGGFVWRFPTRDEIITAELAADYDKLKPCGSPP